MAEVDELAAVMEGDGIDAVVREVARSARGRAWVSVYQVWNVLDRKVDEDAVTFAFARLLDAERLERCAPGRYRWVEREASDG